MGASWCIVGWGGVTAKRQLRVLGLKVILNYTENPRLARAIRDAVKNCRKKRQLLLLGSCTNRRPERSFRHGSVTDLAGSWSLSFPRLSQLLCALVLEVLSLEEAAGTHPAVGAGIKLRPRCWQGKRFTHPAVYPNSLTKTEKDAGRTSPPSCSPLILNSALRQQWG